MVLGTAAVAGSNPAGDAAFGEIIEMDIGEIVQLGLAGAGVLVTFGVMKANIAKQDQAIESQEAQIKAVWDKIYSLRDVYVDQEHFKDVVRSIREDHKEMKADVKSVLQLASEIKARMDKKV